MHFSWLTIAKLKSDIAVMHDGTYCRMVDDAAMCVRSLLRMRTKTAITHRTMISERRTKGWALLAGCLFWAAACETNTLPKTTLASAAPASAAPPAPVAPILDPAFLADRPREHTNSRRVLARIQGDLERIAAGKETSKLPKDITRDPLEAFVPAYRAVMNADADAANALAKVATIAKTRLDVKISSAKSERARTQINLPAGYEIENYVKVVSEIAAEPVKNAEGVMIRLVATMRLVDAVLLLESGHELYDDSYDLFNRQDTMFLRPVDHFRDEIWLRLPCAAIRTHRSHIEAADKRLGKAAASLLSCPTPEKHERDFDFMERFAKSPGESASEVISRASSTKAKSEVVAQPVAPPPPWNLATAIDFMADDPDAAEKPLAAASSKSIVGKLDYALFLQAFRPPSKTRDATIKKLIAEVDKASIVAAKKRGDEFLATDSSLARREYDGTDESLLGSIRFASSSGAGETTSSFYAIPCAILITRPKLLAATEPLFGGNRDNFIPRAGCGWGRGIVRGFPDVEIEAWRDATEEADGKFLFNFSGTMRFGLASGKNLEVETMRTNPRQFLRDDAPKMQWPYETWSYMTPESRTIYQKLFRIAEPLKKTLIAHYKTRGLSDEEAERVARSGLFRIVWGASCGDAPPPRTLRKLFVDGASAAEIRTFIEAGEHKDETRLEPFRECSRTTGMDPLVHVAVFNPEALPVLWELFPKSLDNAKVLDIEIDPNTPNQFGKTPLMVAAQQDQVKSAKLLIDRGASLERSTFKVVDATGEPELGHDARTALMYAAARGSLEMIRLLLDRGADKYTADTKGRRAVHYLLGQGPVAANAKLSAPELAEAAKLLY